ncbi:MAG TPA: transcriptional regulator NrdR [Chloroflexota bacterium]|jgi:transcriptional repressor NrdR|nr:transcriptional regulator NrdR [Chloroflexota bacterium]
MRCPYCEHPKTSVIETRESEETVRRRRECGRCHSRFTTYETARSPGLIVEDGQGARIDFTRSWIQAALVAAGAELPGNALKRVAAGVEAELKTRGSAVVSTGDVASAAARELTQVAASRSRNGVVLPTAEQVGAVLEARFDGQRRTSAQLPLPMGR